MSSSDDVVVIEDDPPAQKRQKISHDLHILTASTGSADNGTVSSPRYQPASLQRRKFPNVSDAFIRKPRSDVLPETARKQDHHMQRLQSDAQEPAAPSSVDKERRALDPGQRTLPRPSNARADPLQERTVAQPLPGDGVSSGNAFGSHKAAGPGAPAGALGGGQPAPLGGTRSPWPNGNTPSGAHKTQPAMDRGQHGQQTFHHHSQVDHQQGMGPSQRGGVNSPQPFAPHQNQHIRASHIQANLPHSNSSQIHSRPNQGQAALPPSRTGQALHPGIQTYPRPPFGSAPGGSNSARRWEQGNQPQRNQLQTGGPNQFQSNRPQVGQGQTPRNTHQQSAYNQGPSSHSLHGQNGPLQAPRQSPLASGIFADEPDDMDDFIPVIMDRPQPRNTGGSMQHGPNQSWNPQGQRSHPTPRPQNLHNQPRGFDNNEHYGPSWTHPRPPGGGAHRPPGGVSGGPPAGFSGASPRKLPGSFQQSSPSARHAGPHAQGAYSGGMSGPPPGAQSSFSGASPRKLPGSFQQHSFKGSNSGNSGVPPQGSSGGSTQSGHMRAVDRQPMANLLLTVKVKLSGDGQIDLDIPYHDGLRQALSRHKEIVWIQSQRVWRSPFSLYEGVLSDLHQVPGVRLNVEELHDVPQRVIKAVQKRRDDSERFKDIPETLQKALMGFQTSGVKFALKRGTRTLIGDEMGLGKTVQAIALLAAYRDKWPAVIITPASLREQWADALHQWLGVTEARMHIINTGKDVNLVQHMFAPGSKKGSREFLILSYSFVGKLKSFFEEMCFKFVVLDESHSIKDPKTQRTKDTVPVVQKAEHALLLSGTPMINRPKEMLMQLSSLVPEAKLKMKDFGERYCLSQNPRFAYSKYDGCCNHEELNKLLISTVMIRRLKKDVLDQLPPKRRQQVFLKLDKPEQAKLDAQTSAMSAARSMTQPGEISADQRRLVMDLYRLTATIKAKAVQLYVEDLLDQDQKFLIFCHHKAMNDAIAEVLNKKKVKHICIDGSVDPKKRQGLVETFQLDCNYKAALLSIQAAGVGLTLTAASVVVFAEYAWSPGEIQQAEDRAHRIGQPSSVNIYFLHVKSSIDDIMWSLVQSKLENLGQAMNGCKESFNIQQSSNHRETNQGSLRGYLSSEPPIDLDSEAPPRGSSVRDHAGPSRPLPMPASNHNAHNVAHKTAHKQSNLKSFFQPGKPNQFLQDDDW